MNSLPAIEQALAELRTADLDAGVYAGELLAIGEAILGLWVSARGAVPTETAREGFRLLALHRQGAKGEPGFNACRETCRELVYHYNLLTGDPAHRETRKRREMMFFVAMHLYLFISGRMQAAALGDFCCSSKPLRQADRARL